MIARYASRVEHITWLDDGYQAEGFCLVAHEGEVKVAFTRVARNGRLLSDLLVVPRADILARVEVAAGEFFDSGAITAGQRANPLLLEA